MLIRPVLVAAAAATLVVVPVSAATAQTYRHNDPTADVESVDLSPQTTMTFTPAPERKEPDVKSIRITHGPRRVTVQMRFVDLTRTPSNGVYVVELRTNEHKYREVDVETGPGHWRGRTSFATGRGPARCKGLSRHVDYDANVVIVRIPRTCLSSPRWIKVAAMAGNEEKTSTSDTGYFDDAQSPKFTANETWSPRIHEG